jgi:hypothetical protein
LYRTILPTQGPPRTNFPYPQPLPLYCTVRRRRGYHQSDPRLGPALLHLTCLPTTTLLSLIENHQTTLRNRNRQPSEISPSITSPSMPGRQGRKDRPRGPDGRFIKKETHQTESIDLEPTKTSKDSESLQLPAGNQPKSPIQPQSISPIAALLALIRGPINNNKPQLNSPDNYSTNPAISHSPTIKASRYR